MSIPGAWASPATDIAAKLAVPVAAMLLALLETYAKRYELLPRLSEQQAKQQIEALQQWNEYALQQCNEKLQKALKEVDKLQQQLKKKDAELEQQLQKKSEELRKLRQQLQKKSEELRKLEKQLQQTLVEAETLQQWNEKLVKALKEVDKLQQWNEELQPKYNLLKQKYNQLKQKYNQLKPKGPNQDTSFDDTESEDSDGSTRNNTRNLDHSYLAPTQTHSVVTR